MQKRKESNINFNILEIFLGADKHWSIRRVLAFAGFIRFISYSGEVEAYIWALASLIAALLGLTTWQNIKQRENEGSA